MGRYINKNGLESKPGEKKRMERIVLETTAIGGTIRSRSDYFTK
ncbi:hypothetical protein [Paenibacillus elgii]|nr:hypothetical protein [Paenibacillus elgii]